MQPSSTQGRNEKCNVEKIRGLFVQTVVFAAAERKSDFSDAVSSQSSISATLEVRGDEKYNVKNTEISDESKKEQLKVIALDDGSEKKGVHGGLRNILGNLDFADDMSTSSECHEGEIEKITRRNKTK